MVVFDGDKSPLSTMLCRLELLFASDRFSLTWAMVGDTEPDPECTDVELAPLIHWRSDIEMMDRDLDRDLSTGGRTAAQSCSRSSSVSHGHTISTSFISMEGSLSTSVVVSNTGATKSSVL